MCGCDCGCDVIVALTLTVLFLMKNVWCTGRIHVLMRERERERERERAEKGIPKLFLTNPKTTGGRPIPSKPLQSPTVQPRVLTGLMPCSSITILFLALFHLPYTYTSPIHTLGFVPFPIHAGTSLCKPMADFINGLSISSLFNCSIVNGDKIDHPGGLVHRDGSQRCPPPRRAVSLLYN